MLCLVEDREHEHEHERVALGPVPQRPQVRTDFVGREPRMRHTAAEYFRIAAAAIRDVRTPSTRPRARRVLGVQLGRRRTMVLHLRRRCPHCVSTQYSRTNECVRACMSVRARACVHDRARERARVCARVLVLGLLCARARARVCVRACVRACMSVCVCARRNAFGRSVDACGQSS